jgi:hypothetical protein
MIVNSFCDTVLCIMLKRLTLKYWTLALLFIFIVAVLGMSRYAEHRKAENQKYAQAGSPESAVCECNAGKSTEKASQPKYPPSWIDTFTWPEGVTAWALLLTLLVIAWQSAETHAAAKATEDAVLEAKAARTHDEGTAKRQLRAYVCLDTAEVAFDGGQPVAYVNFRNSGQTPAYEAHGWAAVEAGPHPLQAPLPLPEKIAKAKYTVGPEAKFGFPGRRKTQLFSEAELASFAKPENTLYVYGRVDYRDAFGDWWYTNFRLVAGGKAGLRVVHKEDGSVRWVLGPDFEGNDAT